MAGIIMGDDVAPSAVVASVPAPSAVVASGPADWEINGIFLGHSGEEIKSAGPSDYSPPTMYRAVATEWKVAQLFKEAVVMGITGGCLALSLLSTQKKFSSYHPNFLHRDLLGRIRFNIFLYQSGIVSLEKVGLINELKAQREGSANGSARVNGSARELLAGLATFGITIHVGRHQVDAEKFQAAFGCSYASAKKQLKNNFSCKESEERFCST